MFVHFQGYNLACFVALTKYTRHLFITETMFSNNFSKASLIETGVKLMFFLFKEMYLRVLGLSKLTY